MKIVLGADPLGYELKEQVKEHLLAEGYELLDVGTCSPDQPVLYIEAADKAAELVGTGAAERGLVFCGTGMGVGIVANKHKGVYCATVESQWAARECRIINNANMLALGGRLVGASLAKDIVDTFLQTQWCENSSAQRKEALGALLGKLYSLEDRNFK